MTTVSIDGSNLSLEQVVAVARDKASVELTKDEAVLGRIKDSRALNEKLIEEGLPISATRWTVTSAGTGWRRCKRA